MDINYELYKVFYYVATTLSFSEASKQLFISQSAVSQSIKAWRRSWIRHSLSAAQSVSQLTPEGEILLRHVEPAMNLIKRGESELMDSATTGGQIRIGASDTICRYFLVPYLKRFHKEFPNAHIKVTNRTFDQMWGTASRPGRWHMIVTNYPNTYLSSLTTVKKIKNFKKLLLSQTENRSGNFRAANSH